MGGQGPPQYFTLETLLIFIHAAHIATIAVYITFAPPKKNEIAFYAYVNNPHHSDQSAFFKVFATFGYKSENCAIPFLNFAL